MKPFKLRMCAFGSYSDEEVLDFSKLGGNGLYLITGETGSGKTTIFDAISYALFGKASGSARSNYKMLRSDYAEGRIKTFVELDFSSGGDSYRIRREIIPHFARKTEEVSYSESVSLDLPDGTVIDRSRDVDAKIAEVVGLDRDQFAQIVMIAQNDFLRFLQSSTDERVKILRRIFNTDALKAFQDNLKARTKIKEDERKVLLRDFEKHGVDHNGARQQFVQWEQEIIVENKTVRLSDERLSELDNAREEYAAKIAVAEGLCGVFDELAAQRNALEEHTLKASEMTGLLQRHKRGEVALRKIKPFADKAVQAENAYAKAKIDIDTAKADAEAATLALQLAEKAITDLPLLDKAQSSFDALKEKWQETSDKLNRLTGLDCSYKDIARKQTTLDKAKAELDAVHVFVESLPSIEQAKEALDNLRRDWEREDEKLKRLSGIEAELFRVLEKQNALTALQEELADLNKTISGLPQLEGVEQQFEQLVDDVEKAYERHNGLLVLQTDWDEITAKQKLLEIAQADLMQLNDDYACAKGKYDEMYERFILGQAGIIAETLREGDPCPVCGAIEHPSPAKALAGDIRDETLKFLLSESDKAKEKCDGKSSECATLISAITVLKGRFHIAATASLPNSNFENAGELLVTEVAAAKAKYQELSEKKTADEISLRELERKSEDNVKRKAEVLPKCAAMQSEVATLKDRFLQDLAIFLPEASWENVRTELSSFISNTQTATQKIAVQKATDEVALSELRISWEESTKKQKALEGDCVALASSVSTLTDRFMKDLSTLIPKVDWDTAGTELSALLIEAADQASELKVRKDIDEAALAKLKTDWDTARNKHTDCQTEMEKAKTCLSERKKREQESFELREETATLFADVICANGFEDEATYSSSLITEDELAAMAQLLADYEESGRQIRRDIERLSKETMDKERPNLEKLRYAFDEVKTTSDSLRLERDEMKLGLEKKTLVLAELRKSADALVKIDREYVAVKSLSDTANGRLDFETYAQMAYFERVLRAANQRLKIMSRNQYALLRKEEGGDGRKRMGLEIEVADSRTGKSRSANSLSGGESFMASLSLALGLSDVVQQSAGGVHLDAMFIDEGFGSLDTEVLELSIRTLSDMADGNRIIGIISHVSELRERIDKQVRVEKMHNGSKIRLLV